MISQKLIVFILAMLLGQVFSNNFFRNKSAARKSLKNEILSLATKTERGLTETEEEKNRMQRLFEDLETLNPTSSVLTSPFLSAVWDLKYTTSSNILGRGSKIPKVGKILQTINAEKLTAENSETVKFFRFLKVPQKVTAELTPVSDSEVAVQFKWFKIGPISFPAPSYFRGSLKITYLDDEWRLSRGDKGSIFVLTKDSPL